jgi:hypothetical protein
MYPVVNYIFRGSTQSEDSWWSWYRPPLLSASCWQVGLKDSTLTARSQSGNQLALNGLMVSSSSANVSRDLDARLKHASNALICFAARSHAPCPDNNSR